jgi:hypothetical protein
MSKNVQSRSKTDFFDPRETVLVWNDGDLAWTARQVDPMRNHRKGTLQAGPNPA